MSREFPGADKNPSVRFWTKVSKTDDCWEWTASRSSDGYGVFYVGSEPGGKRVYARSHRFAYEQLVGPIPDGLVIDHLCRNIGCVNPAHLEPVTNRENVLRGEGICARNAKATHCKYGHEFTEENTYLFPSGAGRACRACRARAALTRRRVA